MHRRSGSASRVDRLVPRRRHGDAERRHLALGRLGPGGIDAVRPGGPSSSTRLRLRKRALERGDARAACSAVHRQHDAVEEAPPLRADGPAKSPSMAGVSHTTRRCSAKPLGGGHGRAIDPAAARCRRPAFGWLEAGAELHRPPRPATRPRPSTDTAQPPRSGVARTIGEFGAPEAAAGREDRTALPAGSSCPPRSCPDQRPRARRTATRSSEPDRSGKSPSTMPPDAGLADGGHRSRPLLPFPGEGGRGEAATDEGKHSPGGSLIRRFATPSPRREEERLDVKILTLSPPSPSASSSTVGRMFFGRSPRTPCGIGVKAIL